MTKPPAASGIAAWNWSFPAKSLVNKSVSPWRSDDRSASRLTVGAFVDSRGGRGGCARRLEVRRRRWFDPNLFHPHRTAVALAGLVRVRTHRASLRLQLEPGAGAGCVMTARPADQPTTALTALTAPRKE